MNQSLALQRSLFRHQARQIARQVQSGSRAFVAYQRRYERATRSYRRVITATQVNKRIAAADVVYVGDYHTLRFAQRAYLELVKQALESGRRVVRLDANGMNPTDLVTNVASPANLEFGVGALAGMVQAADHHLERHAALCEGEPVRGRQAGGGRGLPQSRGRGREALGDDG